MNIAWVWHKASEEKPEKSGVYVVRLISGVYKCIPYSAEHGKWNVTATIDFSLEVKSVVWWAEIITPEHWLITEPSRIYERQHREKIRKQKENSNDGRNHNKCVYCGATIPEGRQVCGICERTYSNEYSEELRYLWKVLKKTENSLKTADKRNAPNEERANLRKRRDMLYTIINIVEDRGT